MRLRGGRTCCLVVRTSCLIIRVWHVCIPLSRSGVGSTSSKRTHGGGGKESSKAGGRDKDSDRLANGQKQGLCQCDCLAFCTFDSGNAAVFVACLTPGNKLNVVAKFPCCMFDFFGFSMSHICVVYCQLKVLCCPYVTGSRSCWPYVDPLLPRSLSCWRKSAPYVGLSGNNDQIQVLPLFEPMVPHFGLTYVLPYNIPCWP